MATTNKLNSYEPLVEAGRTRLQVLTSIPLHLQSPALKTKSMAECSKSA